MVAPHRFQQNARKKLWKIQECYVLFWTNPRNRTLQDSNCLATCHPSHPNRTIKTCQTLLEKQSRDELISLLTDNGLQIFNHYTTFQTVPEFLLLNLLRKNKNLSDKQLTSNIICVEETPGVSKDRLHWIKMVLANEKSIWEAPSVGDSPSFIPLMVISVGTDADETSYENAESTAATTIQTVRKNVGLL